MLPNIRSVGTSLPRHATISITHFRAMDSTRWLRLSFLQQRRLQHQNCLTTVSLIARDISLTHLLRSFIQYAYMVTTRCQQHVMDGMSGIQRMYHVTLTVLLTNMWRNLHGMTVSRSTGRMPQRRPLRTMPQSLHWQKKFSRTVLRSISLVTSWPTNWLVPSHVTPSHCTQCL